MTGFIVLFFRVFRSGMRENGTGAILSVSLAGKMVKTACEGWDSNPRTPTRLGPQPSAFDLAWLPSLSCHYKKVVYLIKTCDRQGEITGKYWMPGVFCADGGAETGTAEDPRSRVCRTTPVCQDTAGNPVQFFFNTPAAGTARMSVIMVIVHCRVK